MGKKLIVLTIDLGDRKGELCVREKEDPEEVAKMFVKKHGLNKSAEVGISQFITRTLVGLSPGNSKPLTPVGLKFTTSPTQALSKSFSKSKTLNTSLKSNLQNPGERIYSEAILRERLKEMKIFKILAERKAVNKQHLTFRPTIHKIKGLAQRNRGETDFLERQKLLRQSSKKAKLENDEQGLRDFTFKPEINKTPAQDSKKKLLNKGAYLFYTSEHSKKVLNSKSPTARNLNSKLKIDLSPKVVEVICRQNQGGKTKNQEFCGGYSARENRTPSSTAQTKSVSKRKSEKVLKRVHDASHASKLKKSRKKLNTSLKLIKYEEVSNQIFNIN